MERNIVVVDSKKYKKGTSTHLDIPLPEEFGKKFTSFCILSLVLPNRFKKSHVNISLAMEGVERPWFGEIVKVPLAKKCIRWREENAKVHEITKWVKKVDVPPYICIRLLDEEEKQVQNYNCEWSMVLEFQ